MSIKMHRYYARAAAQQIDSFRPINWNDYPDGSKISIALAVAYGRLNAALRDNSSYALKRAVAHSATPINNAHNALALSRTTDVVGITNILDSGAIE